MDDEGEVEPDEASADVWRYEGAFLRLDALVAEQVALAYPMRALCDRGEACRGLCSNCGCELNPLPAAIRRCPQCHNAVPLTPVADLPGHDDSSDPDEVAAEREGRSNEGPLAAALRKLDLD